MMPVTIAAMLILAGIPSTAATPRHRNPKRRLTNQPPARQGSTPVNAFTADLLITAAFAGWGWAALIGPVGFLRRRPGHPLAKGTRHGSRADPRGRT